MAVVPPPWETLTTENISQRLSAFSARLTLSTNVHYCYTTHAVYSTGSAVVDEMLPDGGVACGTVMEIVGPPAAGKSHFVRRMIAAFVARAAVQWTPTPSSSSSNSNNIDININNDGDKEEEEEEDVCTPRDWCVFLVVSDPSSHSPRQICELLKKSLNAASVRGVRSGCYCYCNNNNNNNNNNNSCSNHDTNSTECECCLRKLLEKVKMVTFTSPNDLLMFFRYLSRVEFAAIPYSDHNNNNNNSSNNNNHHHRQQRRVLVIVDSIARLWEDPVCGANVHARHWMAAELVREVRIAIAVGNGWRHPPCEGEIHSDPNPTISIPSMNSANINNNNNSNINSNNNSNINSSSGGVAIVFVNGCKNMYSHTSIGRDAEKRPLGVPVWWAAAADLRLFVEPIAIPDAACNINTSTNNNYNINIKNNINININKCYGDVSETQTSRHDVQKMMKVSLVKGGRGVGSAVVVMEDKNTVV